MTKISGNVSATSEDLRRITKDFRTLPKIKCPQMFQNTFEHFRSYLRVDVSKDQRSGGQSSKFAFAYTLYIGRPRYYTYEIKVYLAKYCFVSKKFDFNCKRYFSS